MDHQSSIPPKGATIRRILCRVATLPNKFTRIFEEFLLKISTYIDSKIHDVLENEYKEYLNTVKQNWINNRKIEFGLRSEKYYES